MTDHSMPALPEPTYIYHFNPSTGEDDLFEFASSGAIDEDCKYCERLYTAAQMHAYAQPLLERIKELEAALQLVLPMAKGYARAHNVGSNQAYCDQADAAISTKDKP